MNVVQDHIAVAKEQLPALVGQLSQLAGRSFVPTHTAQVLERAADLERLLARLLFAQLQALDLFSDAHAAAAAWKRQVGLPALYERWLEESLRVLARHGYISLDGAGCSVNDPTVLDSVELWAEWEAKQHTWLQDEQLSAQVRLVDTTLRALPEILTGRRPATDVIFPDSSMRLVEGIYKKNQVADHFNAVLADTLVEFVQACCRHDPAARIRILEIGAGTGGTSEGLFERLEPWQAHIAEYCYTDISKAFLLHAERSYAARAPYLRCRLFNIEQALESQGIEPGTYDVVIAANVLHATRNIRNTVRNAKAVLKRNGMLLLHEMLGNRLFTHLTFGLLEGWWLYEDAPLRIPGTPGLSPQSWSRVLGSEGFSPVFFPAQAAHEHGAQIVVSQSDGLIRQRREIPGIRTAIPTSADRRAPIVRRAAAKSAPPADSRIEDYVRQVLLERVAESLQMAAEDVDADGSFGDYGLDSIMSVQTARAISAAFAIELQSTSLFDYPTVNKLAAYLLTEHPAGMAAAAPREAAIAAERASEGPRQHTVLAIPAASRRSARGKRAQPVDTAVTRSASTQPLLDLQPQLRPIAIIGMSGRFPRSETVAQLWQHLANGDELTEDVSRWNLPHAASDNDTLCRRGGFLSGIELFDPLFFNISGVEATFMDPQQRLFLEECWKALEDAGYVGSAVEGRLCGVYVGCAAGDYSNLFAGEVPAQAMWGSSASVTPARISYCLNLQGPAIAIDTACSSSLVAMHLACQALWAGETEMALAGGVAVQCIPRIYLMGTHANMLSRTGRCHTFDERADGFIPGEGVGVLVLKRLQDALRAGDHIYGVIRGSGINQDGTTSGITAPSAVSQERLERRVYETFGIDPADIQMVEAHGTGTKLGDPIEFRALTQAFRKSTEQKRYCAIGSIKTNIGHTLTAAGIAGVIKILLALQHRQIPPSLHYEHGNSHIDFENSPFFVNTTLRPWTAAAGKTRRAAVSSFGVSGTNAHMVIEEAPSRQRAHAERPGYLVTLSARCTEQLEQQVQRLVLHCEANAGACGDMSYTLLLGRKHFNHRLACVARTAADLAATLRRWMEKGKAAHVHTAVLAEKDRRGQAALRRHGNECIEQCRAGAAAEEYLESLDSIAELYVQGYELSFERLFADDEYSRVSLPTYPFARERYWVEAAAPRQPDVSDTALEPASVAVSTVAEELADTAAISAAPHAGTARRAELKGLTLEQCVLWELQELASELLQLPRTKLSADGGFADFGFDSIALATYAQRLSARYSIEITPAIFFSHSTFTLLAEHLLGEHATVMRECYREDTQARARQTPSRATSRPAPAASAAPRSAQQSAAASADARAAEPIAIVGMSGRFPGARSIAELWQVLIEGTEAVQEIPLERFDWRNYYQPQAPDDASTPVPPGKTNCKWLGVVPGVDEFDPLFFEISPREAEVMDPRQRLLLQEAFNALEDAGYGNNQLGAQRIGAFVGVEQGDYQFLVRASGASAAVTANHDAILAARLSYFLSLRGPVIAMNTACSSALVAAHQACLSLKSGECDAAIAAGVNLMVSAHGYLGMSQAGMLSPDGRCHTFDRRANGMVPGEAVVAVVLKRLLKAQQEGDAIYAVIRGSGINYDGRTNGMTAPSGAAQAQLVQEVMQRAAVTPADIQYIVAHGTGTRLGDPVEIQALRDAFKDVQADTPFCALTSTKTNFGHTLGASGLVSLVSLVQALRHRTIPASLHCEQLSDYIDWKRSPFFVNTSNRAWSPPADRPRIGAVSAFGISGTNAHMVVEGYETAAADLSGFIPAPAYLIALSAKTEAALQQRARDLLSALREAACDWNAATLASLSRTLLLHRQHFLCRCAFVAADQEELLVLLEKAAGEERWPALLRGKVSRELIEQPALKQYAGELIAKLAMRELQPQAHREALGGLADLYRQGYALDWPALCVGETLPRLRLPTYPFARERYWVKPPVKPATGSLATSTGASLLAALHPLVHRNTSTLSGQRFSSTFSAEEAFLRDHRVDGENLFSGALHLRMAAKALELATADAARSEPAAIRFEQVAWSQPMIVAAESREIHIGLYPQGDGVDYEIYSPDTAGQSSQTVVHSRGRMLLQAGQYAPSVELQALQARCRGSARSSEQIYATFEQAGVLYGPTCRGLESLATGIDERGQPLGVAQLVTAHGVNTSLESLPEGVLESALQLAAALHLLRQGESGTAAAVMPVELEALEVAAVSRRSRHLIARHVGGSAQMPTFDVEACDEHGVITLRMRGLTVRSKASGDVIAAPEIGTTLLERYWSAKPLAVDVPAGPPIQERYVLLDPAYHEHVPQLQAAAGGSLQIEMLEALTASTAERFSHHSEQLFTILQRILRDQPRHEVLVQVVVSQQQTHAELWCALSAMLKSAHQENPRLIGQVLQLASVAAASELLDTLERNGQLREDGEVRYCTGERQVASVRAMDSVPPSNVPATALAWRAGGVYLITGGAGGLGLIFAAQIAEQARDCRIVLTGRSPLGAVQREALTQLQANGARLDYRQVDVGDAASVRACIEWVVAEHGSLSGIIHSAGVIHDSFLIKKTLDEVRGVLAPKVRGVINLDEATAHLPLEFFVTFSSIAGVFGNVGQSDYATANAFMDAYAVHRRALVRAGQRHGRSLSINWPLWESGGMSVDAATRAMMFEAAGWVPMPTAHGVDVFRRALQLEQAQVVVLAHDRTWRRASAVQTAAPLAQQPDEVQSSIEPQLLQEKTLHQMQALFGEVTNLAPGRIDTSEPLESYGIDSIMIMQLNHKLTRVFGELSKTLWFEYRTLDALVGYLVATHAPACVRWSGLGSSSAAATPTRTHSPPRAASSAVSSAASSADGEWPALRRRVEQRRAAQLGSTAQAGHEPIAIIGVSARYPGAAGLDEYWDVLQAGKDCVGEIPAERWPLQGFYHPDVEQALRHGLSYCKWGAFVDGFADFDPLFFSISPRETLNMDPQERLFIQASWEVLEDAAYTREMLAARHRGRVGVFVGITKTGFDLYGPPLWQQGDKSYPHTSFGSVANRVSYLLDLHGPSMPIDTMCSASLTAVHEACEHLLRGECELAIAGGVNLYLHPSSYIGLSGARMLSPDGRCKSFGAGGNGMVPGEGVGAVLLKPLSKALADEDRIHALILGTSINHGGKTNGYSVPNPAAQGELIRLALDKARIHPRMVSYIEAHGTGTELGDPIEMAGLTKAFSTQTQDTQFCAIGSVKSNIGHLEAAAGIAGLTKIVLQMKHRQLVPSLHAQALNPHIDFTTTAFLVQQALSPWEAPTVTIEGRTQRCPRIAGISSFGAGGANAHAIVQEHCAEPASPPARVTAEEPALIVLSAKSEARLREQAARLLAYCTRHAFSQDELASIAYTLQKGREAMEYRLAFAAATPGELQEKLTACVNHEAGRGSADVYWGETKKNKEALSSFNAEDLASLMQTWLAKRKYEKLLEVWVKGASVDWDELYADGRYLGGTRPRRISLPTYPFAKERYWIDLAPASGERRRPAEQHAPAVAFEKHRLKSLLESVVAGEVDARSAAASLKSTLQARS
jgi:acyl transferase domain-containing protein/SAM-dependent methyltransferase